MTDSKERKNINLQPGSIVKVWQKIKEGDKTRLQSFEGLIIAKKHGLEPGATFTVRKMVGDIGVERIFPLYSPNIEKIEIVSHSKPPFGNTKSIAYYFIFVKFLPNEEFRRSLTR